MLQIQITQRDPSFMQKIYILSSRPMTAHFLAGSLLCVSALMGGCTGAEPAEKPDLASHSEALVNEQSLLNPQEEPAEATVIAFAGGKTTVFSADELRAVLPSDDSLLQKDTIKPPPGTQGKSATEQPSAKERLLAQVSHYPPEQLVQVLFAIDDVKFGWHLLKTKDFDGSAKRAAALEVRRKQMEGHTASIRAKLAKLGAQEVETFLSTSSIAARVPAGMVAELANWPEVKHLAGEEQLNATTEFTQPSYGGHEARAGMKITAFESDGINATTGGRAGGRVRVGIIDEFALNSSHTGFMSRAALTFPHIPSSCFLGTYNCSSGTSCSSGAPTFTAGTEVDHPTKMGKIINGFISGTSTDARRKSGIIPSGGADLYLYGAYTGTNSVTGPAFVRSIDRALLDQVDVVNVSLNFSGYPDNMGVFPGCCAPCDLTCDCGGMNTSIKNATDGGILIVKSAGNLGQKIHTDTSTNRCLTTYPANRKDVLAVGGVVSNPYSTNYDTSPTWTGDADQLPYLAYDVETGSSRGGMTINTGAGLITEAVAVVDLAAPAHWSFDYVDASSFETTGTSPGTSGSAAATSGVAAMLRSAAYSSASAYNWSGRTLLANMLLLGDGYKSSGATTGPITGFDKRSGAGRIHAHYPAASSLGPVWSWGVISDTVTQGQSKAWYVVPPLVSIAERAQITQLKTALVFEEQDFTNAADLDLRITWGCAGTGTGTVLAADLSLDVRSRVSLKPSDAPSALRDMNCWTVRVDGYRVPGGVSRAFKLAYYYHSQDPANH